MTAGQAGTAPAAGLAGDDMPPGLAALDALMRTRRSCRAFLPGPLPRPLIAAVLATAQRAASWSNTQPWWLHVVSGAPLEAIRGDLFARSEAPPAPELDWPREIRGAHRERRRECGWGLYAALGIGKGDRAASARQVRENFRFFGAPHVVLVTCDAALGTHGVMDCGAWVFAFLLAAAAAGVDAVAQGAVAAHPDVWRRRLDIAADHRIVCAVAFGRADPAHPANAFRAGRAPLDEVVTFVG